jgi:hypothetical protein
MKIKLLIALNVFLVSNIAIAQNSNISRAKDAVRSAANMAANASYSPTPEPPKTKITGRIIYEDTGKPVRRGSVVLLRIPKKNDDSSENRYESLNEASQSNVTTNDDGEFAIDGIFAGEYYPKVNVAGVLKPDTFEAFYKDNTEISFTNLEQIFERIIVIEGVKEQYVLIRAKRGGAIGGRVLYSDGEPAIGVDVEVLRNGKYGFENSSESIGKTKTDDRGFYRFSSLLNGEYIIRAIEPTTREAIRYSGSSSTSELKTYYGDSNNAKDAKIIELLLAEEKIEINVTIPDRKIYTISGVVVSKSSKVPIKGARISFLRSGEDAVLSYSVRTSYYDRSILSDEKGQWKITDLPKGTFVITVSPPYNFQPAYRSAEEAEDAKLISKKELKYAESKKELKLDDKDLENVVIEMPIASKISGTIQFEDKSEIKDLYVSIYDEEKEISKGTSSQSAEYKDSNQTKPIQWGFEISEVSEGKYFLYVSGFSKQVNYYIKSINLGGKDLLTNPLDLKESDEVKDIKIILANDVGTVKGKIETSDEKQLKSMRVVLVSTDNPNARVLIFGASVGENGDFVVKAAPKEYYVIVQPISVLREAAKLKHEEWVQKFTKDAQKITVKANETTNVTIKK